MITNKLIGIIISFSPLCASAQIDFSEVAVARESGIEFLKITSDNDHVCMPTVKRRGKNINWFTNRIIDISVDGNQLAFLAVNNNATNIYIKDLNKNGNAIQRTNRQAILDFSFSPDGNYICFSEKNGQYNQVFQTSAQSGYICRQITSNSLDYSPTYTMDMNKIIFTRQEGQIASIWSYNTGNNYLEYYTKGMNPAPLKNNVMLCTRTTSDGRGEIWRIDSETGIEECIVSDPNRSFTTPSLSPDGKWILMVGSGIVQDKSLNYANTEIYVCHIDGSQLRRLTYHPADDISPVWSRDGRYIYFVSQRGSYREKTNVWRMSFNL